MLNSQNCRDRWDLGIKWLKYFGDSRSIIDLDYSHAQELVVYYRLRDRFVRCNVY